MAKFEILSREFEKELIALDEELQTLQNRAEDLNYFKEVEFTINCGEKTTWDCHFIANKFEKIPYKDVYYQEFELQY